MSIAPTNACALCRKIAGDRISAALARREAADLMLFRREAAEFAGSMPCEFAEENEQGRGAYADKCGCIKPSLNSYFATCETVAANYGGTAPLEFTGIGSRGDGGLLPTAKLPVWHR
jgi:hypothetical protein